MNRTLIHRGPDGEGYFHQGGVGLGHRRLAIIDLQTGDQPMISEKTGHVLVFNGEIYNFLELRRDLQSQGFQFRTESDTEVLLAAWVKWGVNCINRLNGMFAFAVWDPIEEELHLVRDRVGKKPLYYSALSNGTLLFASELKALLRHPDFSRDLDDEAVSDYLTYGYVPDPKSIYRFARKLSPGHRLSLKRGRAVEIVRYWKPRFEPCNAMSREQVLDQTLENLDAAVGSRLIADVPLGAFLSGGVDSTAVVASVVAKHGVSPLETFSVGFGDPDFDELKIAKAHADRYQTAHHEHIQDPLLPGLFEKATAIYDEPFADSSAMPTYQVCASAREHVTVALSGDGGDESFAGYRRYIWHMQEERVRRLLPDSFRSGVFGTLGRIYPKMDRAPQFMRFKSTLNELSLDAVGAYGLSLAMADANTHKSVLSPEFVSRLSGYTPLSVLVEHWNDSGTDDPLNKALYADWQMWLPGRMLVKVDRASMANSLEVRSPFLDHRFLEWSASLPSHFKIKGRTGKSVLKEALRARVEPGILYRKKQGFAPPVAAWLRGPMRPQLETALGGEAFRDSGFFALGTVDKLLAEHLSGARDHGPVLWSFLVFSEFLKRN